jgi:hypothetical protein
MSVRPDITLTILLVLLVPVGILFFQSSMRVPINKDDDIIIKNNTLPECVTSENGFDLIDQKFVTEHVSSIGFGDCKLYFHSHPYVGRLGLVLFIGLVGCLIYLCTVPYRVVLN